MQVSSGARYYRSSFRQAPAARIKRNGAKREWRSDIPTSATAKEDSGKRGKKGKHSNGVGTSSRDASQNNAKVNKTGGRDSSISFVRKKQNRRNANGRTTVTGFNRPTTADNDGTRTRLSRYSFNKTTSTTANPPTTLDAEHRHILSVVSRTLNDLRTFKVAYKTMDVNFDDCMTLAMDIVNQLKKNEEQIVTGQDFFALLGDKSLSADSKRTPEFGQLEFLCEKHKRFEDIVPRIKDKLNDVYKNNLGKYCLSFIEETQGIYIKAICDYEDNIVEMRKSLEKNMKQSNEHLEEYLATSTPFISVFLKNGAGLQEQMDLILNQAIEACDVMKTWVQFDKEYPSKLWDAVLEYSENKGKTTDNQKILEKKRSRESQATRKLELSRDKYYQRQLELKQNKKKLKTHIEGLIDRKLQTQNTLNDLQYDLEKVEAEIRNRQQNSPKYLERLADRDFLLKQNIAKVGERLEMLDRQDLRYAQLDHALDCEIQELEDKLRDDGELLEHKRDKLKGLEDHMQQEGKTLQMKQDIVHAARKVRDLKLSPQTLRKIYFQKMDANTKDLLQDACRVVALDIGHDWEKFYKDLKFVPNRDSEKRDKDIEALKLHSVQREKTTRMLAFSCLQKWRVFSKRVSIEELISSLRRIEKYAIAHRLEHRYLKSATAK